MHGKADNDGVGLVLHEDDLSGDMLVFAVIPSDGSWLVARFDAARNTWDGLQYGDSGGAIRTGDNAANRLLVILHGGTDVCYINNQLVGTVTDPLYTSTPGHVGVYLNNGATAGIFNDFAVYPAQPASSFFYV